MRIVHVFLLCGRSAEGHAKLSGCFLSSMEPLFHFDRLGGADQPGQPRGGGGDCYKGLGGGFTTKLSHRDRNVQHFSALLLIRFAWALKAGGVGGLPGCCLTDGGWPLFLKAWDVEV